MRTGEGTLTIGEVAAQAGVNVETLRYYERRGLLKEPARVASGRRRYPLEVVDFIRSVKQAQSLGFTLAEIEEFISVGAHRPARSGEALAAGAARKLAEIDEKIAALHEMRTGIEAIIEHGCDSLTNCRCGAGCPVGPSAVNARSHSKEGHAMTSPESKWSDTLELLSCDIAARPAAPGASELQRFVTAVKREPTSLTFEYDRAAGEMFAAFTAAEQVCCSTIGWALDEAAGNLRITASAEQLDALQAIFAAA